jgi:hypothetical protein
MPTARLLLFTSGSRVAPCRSSTPSHRSRCLRKPSTKCAVLSPARRRPRGRTFHRCLPGWPLPDRFGWMSKKLEGPSTARCVPVNLHQAERGPRGGEEGS